MATLNSHGPKDAKVRVSTANSYGNHNNISRSYYSPGPNHDKRYSQNIEQLELGPDNSNRGSNRVMGSNRPTLIEPPPSTTRKVWKVFQNHTQIDIIRNYLIACAIAGSLFAVYNEIDGREVKDTSRLYKGQKLLRIAEYTIISFLSFALTSSLNTSYLQLLFLRFRKKPYTALQIDRLLTLTRSNVFGIFWSGFRFEAIGERCFIVLSVFLIAAMSVSFGAVDIIPIVNKGGPHEVQVPSGDIANIGRNTSLNDMLSTALFSYEPQTLHYLAPKPLTSYFTSRVLGLRSGALFPEAFEFPKFWGPMEDYKAYYSVKYKGPSYQCREEDVSGNFTSEYSGLSEEIQYLMDGDGQSFRIWFQRAYRAENFDSEGSFEGLVKNVSSTTKTKFVAISCSLGITNYDLTVGYEYGTPAFVGPKKDGKVVLRDDTFDTVNLAPKNATLAPYSGYSSDRNSTIPKNYTADGLPSGQPLWQQYLHLQSLALSDALTDNLRGSIKNFGKPSQKVTNTTILSLSRFTRISLKNNTDTLELFLTASNLEKALEDIATSLHYMDGTDWRAYTYVTTLRPTEIYHFDRYLYVYPIGIVLGFALLLNLLGLYCLYRNGVPASDRFLSHLCTTAASQALREAAWKNTHGGGDCDGDFPEELRNIRVQFGRTRDNSSMGSFSSDASGGLPGGMGLASEKSGCYEATVEVSRSRDWEACFGTGGEVGMYPLKRTRWRWWWSGKRWDNS